MVQDMAKTELVDRVLAVLSARGWSPYQWAKNARLSGSTVRNMISRRSTASEPETLRAMAEAAGVSLLWLEHGQGEMDSIARLVPTDEPGAHVGPSANAPASLAEAIVSLREAAASAPTIPTEVEIEKARADLVAFRAAGAKLSESTRSAQRRVDALDADVVAARDVARKAHAAFQDARTKAKASEDRAAELRRKLAELAVEREEAVTARSEATPAADVSELRNQVAALEAEARTARTNALRLGNAANAQAALAKRRQQARESEAAAKSLRALVDLIAAARVALLEISRDPIAEVATDIAQRVIGARIKVEGGDIRIIRDAVSYSVDTASDAERVVVLMAFALAVRMRLPGWRPVFVDRLDALEPALRERFATVLRELLAEGKIDNLVIALHGDASVAPPGFNVIELPGA